MAYIGLNKQMDAAAETGSTRFSLSIEISDDEQQSLPKPPRETKFSGANEDRENFIFPVSRPLEGLATLPG